MADRVIIILGCTACKNRNYHFIMGYTKDGAILLANDSLDITENVIEGLNEEYKENSK